MLRHVVFQSSKLLDNSFVATSINLQFVRFRRKPRWLPVAKSKMFRVPERKPQDPEERLELLRLHNNYKLCMRSITSYLHKEAQVKLKTSSAGHLVLTPEQEEAEFQKCLAENDAWNAKIASDREIRFQKEAEERKAYVAKKLEEAEIRSEEQREKVEEIVRLEKERSKTYITNENLDAAIEFALANPVDHNFAIDMEGNIYRGRDAAPAKKDEKTLSATG